MGIRAMVLSDLHFGDNNSVLHTGHPDRNQILKKLFDEMQGKRADAGPNGEKIPYLILNVDAYDLSFAEYAAAFQDAQGFFNDLKKTGLFDQIIFIPGNHDHHLWWLYQQENLVMKPIQAGNPGEMEPLIHIHSAALDLGNSSLAYYDAHPQLQGSNFLDTLTGHKVNIVYPNLYLTFKEDVERKAIMVTHGHFFENMWTLATDMFPKNIARRSRSFPNLYLLEKINSAFTEFGWHALGQTGPFTKMIEDIYEEVSIGKVSVLNDALVEVRDYLDNAIDFKSESIWGEITDYFKEKSSDALLNVALAIVKEGIKKYVRSTEGTLITEARLRYTNILEREDILKQIARYHNLSLPDCHHLEIIALIFGHTHDACFKQTVTEEKLKNITFYNTGGFIKEENGQGPEWRLLSILDDGRII